MTRTLKMMTKVKRRIDKERGATTFCVCCFLSSSNWVLVDWGAVAVLLCA